jgi:cupin fold WbuC family metalloprotein
MNAPAFPTALSAPEGMLNAFGWEDLADALAASRQSPRRRIILPLHKASDTTLHRMFNIVQPRSYIRPHRHLSTPKAEGLVILRGAVEFFEFADDGQVLRHFTLSAEGPKFIVDIEPGVIHTFVALREDTVIYEVKSGPYAAATDKDFAAWAPAEGAPGVAAYLDMLYQSAAVAK